MMQTRRTALTLLFFVTAGADIAFGADPALRSPDGVWSLLRDPPADRAALEPWVRPAAGQLIQLDQAALERQLNTIPLEFTQEALNFPAMITLPTPDGGFARFTVVDSPVVAPELAAKFPETRTFAGRGIDDTASTIRFDWTPLGFHAQVLTPGGSWYIDPYSRGDNAVYTSYYKRDLVKAADGWQCLADETDIARILPGSGRDGHDGSGGGGERAVVTLRTYRLANACTGEYSAFFGGTVPNSHAAIVTAINRVTGVYEIDLAVRLVLVANNDSLIFLNAGSDPYDNFNGGNMLSQNNSTCNTIIGTGNYDIGHVFSTGGGGVAQLGVVCTGSKGAGVTGLGSPIGDAFYIDYVAHEMGHQFGANHTFNSSTSSCGGGNRSASHAYEPGSGSTIMAYAGICGGDDLQPHSDAYFHSDSLDAIASFTRTGSGNSCPVQSAPGNNTPTVSAGAAFTIPAQTPFALTATGSDTDGDSVTYCWEERDLGASTTLGAADNGASPLFRSFNPTTNPTRTFPSLNFILAGASNPAERLPTTSRTMNFRATARDNHAGGGGFASSQTTVTSVAAAGPFTVTAPSGSCAFAGDVTVTWNVANTTASPINCANVKISLSTDGGSTFPTVLIASTPNDGSQVVTLPAVTSSNCRIKVEGVGNIFFNIGQNFSINPVLPPCAFNLSSPANGASGVSVSPTLSWAASTNAISYAVTVDTDPAFALPNAYTTTTASTSVALPASSLGYSTTYYWRVVASSSAGGQTSANPNPAQFTTVAPPPCLGDVNGDHHVDTSDLTVMLGFFGQSVSPGTFGDINGDGTVNTLDLTALLGVFGTNCP